MKCLQQGLPVPNRSAFTETEQKKAKKELESAINDSLKKQWERQLKHRELWWQDRLHTYEPMGFNLAGTHKPRRNLRKSSRQTWAHGRGNRAPLGKGELARAWDRRPRNKGKIKRPDVKQKREKSEACRKRNIRLGVRIRKAVEKAKKTFEKQLDNTIEEVEAATSEESDEEAAEARETEENEDRTKHLEVIEELQDEHEPTRRELFKKIGLWDGINDEWKQSVKVITIENSTAAQWPQDFDFDCQEAWDIITAISSQCQTNDIQQEDLHKWQQGSLIRLLAANAWFKNKSYCPTIGEIDSELGRRISITESGTCEDVRVILTEQLRKRTAERKRMQGTREIWINPYTSRTWEDINLEQISHDPEIMAAFPQEVADVGGYPVLCWQYNIPLGLTLCTDKKTINDYERSANRTCKCHLITAAFKNKSGHVATTDMKFTERICGNDTLRKKLQLGTTFRDAYHDVQRNGSIQTALGSVKTRSKVYSDTINDGLGEQIKYNRTEKRAVDSMYQYMEWSITAYIATSASINGIPESWYKEWKYKMLHKIEEAIQAQAHKQGNRACIDNHRGNQQQQDELKEAHTKLTKDYVLLTADKAKNTYCIMCKPHFCKLVKEDIEKSDAYELISEDSTDDSTQTDPAVAGNIQPAHTNTRVARPSNDQGGMNDTQRKSHSNNNTGEGKRTATVKKALDEHRRFMTEEGLANDTRGMKEKDMPPEKYCFNENLPKFGAVLKTHKDFKSDSS